VGGDFNCVLDTSMDRSSILTGLTRSAGVVWEEMEEFGLVEVWRHRHSTSKEYSFHPQVHDSFSRIDLVLLSSSLLHRVESCSYLPRSISGHSPLKVVMDPCLNPRFLATEESVTMVRNLIDEYLVHNSPSSSTTDYVWEALKATLCGHIISHSVAYKNKYRAQLLNLELDLHQAETEDYKCCASAESQERVVKIRHDLNISTSKAEDVLYYAKVNKAGKLPAWQLWKVELEHHISVIRVPKSAPSGDPKVINKGFASYYSSLYTSESSFQGSRGCMSLFLDALPIPSLTEEDKTHIDQPISNDMLLFLQSPSLSFPAVKEP
uniref:Endonuclease/exonuclease/phosphatase domain-containing protein n=1 Tax=Latimeria chalumnae TaxID=7897 RepID=H3B4Y6_LATCH